MQNIVLLHGALGASSDLQALGDILKNRGLTVYSFSFSGHSKIPFQKEFDIEQFSHELGEFIHQNKLTGVNIFGYSMGGFVALNLALKQNYPLNKIITLGTKFNWNEASIEKETKQLNPEIIIQKVPTFAKMLAEKHGENWKDLMHKTSAMMKKIGRDNPLNSDLLKKIEIPVLIGLADKDQMVSLEETVLVFKTLQKASMYMMPNTRHQFETVNTTALSNVIVHFIEG